MMSVNKNKRKICQAEVTISLVTLCVCIQVCLGVLVLARPY